MARFTRPLLCVLAAGVTVAALSTGAAPATSTSVHHPAVGIGDNKADMFTDPRFLALRVKNVRYDMSWDALTVTYQRQEVKAWMNAAKTHGLSVLLTIDHSDRVIYKNVKVHGKAKREAFSQVRVMPTTAEYVKAFNSFRKTFPWVKQFVTWDETNCYCEGSYDKETEIAAYYRGMREACPSCTLLAAEFLDTAKQDAVPMATWVSKLDKALGYQPGYWGLNDYEDANHLVSTQTRQLLKLVRGKVWLAETGGVVKPAGGRKTGV